MQDEKLKKIGIDSKLIDEIVEEIVSSIKSEKRGETTTEDVIGKRNLAEIIKLKERTTTLENRLEKYISNFKLVATEVERLITEKTEALNEESQQQIVHLQGQIEDLRISMIKLGSEMKKISERMKY